jgi:hypothetical protein
MFQPPILIPIISLMLGTYILEVSSSNLDRVNYYFDWATFCFSSASSVKYLESKSKKSKAVPVRGREGP